MFDFYVACVRHYSCTKDCFYWKPLKIYTSRSSCLRFFKSYECKSFEYPIFGILKIDQDSIPAISFKEVAYAED